MSDVVLSKIKDTHRRNYATKQDAIVRIHVKPESAIHECSLMQKVSHDNLHKLVTQFSPSTLIWEDYDLPVLVKLHLYKDNVNLVQLFQQSLIGLKHLHRNGIVHTNIDPTKFIVSEGNSVKIAYFSHARQVYTQEHIDWDIFSLADAFKKFVRIYCKENENKTDRFRSVLLMHTINRLLHNYVPTSDALHSIVFSPPESFMKLIVEFCKNMELHNGGRCEKPNLFNAIYNTRLFDNWHRTADKDFYETLKKNQPINYGRHIPIRNNLYGLLKAIRNTVIIVYGHIKSNA